MEDNNNNIKVDSVDEDFKELLEKSMIKGDNFAVGQRVSGTVLLISNNNIFVDISGKSEAVIDIEEFLDKQGKLNIKEGDSIDAYIVSTGGGEITLTTAIGRGQSNTQLLNNAYTHAIPVEGIINGTVKGGYRVTISGISCFCPYSQIDIRVPQNKDDLLEKKFTFRIIEYTEGGKNIILSRRVLIEEKQQERENELRNSLEIGDILSGKITSQQNFGLFVDIGGFEALLPQSEISWSRDAQLKSFTVGMEISVKVISIDWDTKRIVLSIKQLTQEPWVRIDLYKAGNTYNGKVINTIKSGAFIEIEPGLEGYIPLSRMSRIKRVTSPEEVLAVNDVVQVDIIEINTSERKILLELITGEPDPWSMPLDDISSKINIAIIESSRNSGIFVRLANGMSGFVPLKELAAKKGTDIQKAYPAGKEVQVVITDIYKEDKKLKLSEKGALKHKETQEFRKYMDKSNSGNGGATFGNIFKDKLDELKKNVGKN